MLNIAVTNDAGKGGVRDIAGVLGGGIKEGSLVLIEGESKTGKSVLSQHIAYGVLRSKESGIAYYTTDYNSSGLIEQMDSMSLDVRHDLVTDRLRVYQVGTENALTDPRKSMKRLLNHFTTLPGRFNLVMVDTASPFLTRVNTMIKMSFLQSCKQFCEKERSIILALDTHVFDEEALARAHEMSDYYLNLKTPDMLLESGRVDPRAIKVLKVTKLGGANRQWNSGIRFEIKPKIGIQILPFVQVKI